MSETYKTRITTVGGDVFMSLPDDQYIEMSPEKARKLAASLFIKANEAEGLPAPELIMLQKSAARS